MHWNPFRMTVAPSVVEEEIRKQNKMEENKNKRIIN